MLAVRMTTYYCGASGLVPLRFGVAEVVEYLGRGFGLTMNDT
jgi:hypothetical protein